MFVFSFFLLSLFLSFSNSPFVAMTMAAKKALGHLSATFQKVNIILLLFIIFLLFVMYYYSFFVLNLFLSFFFFFFFCRTKQSQRELFILSSKTLRAGM